MFGRILPDGVHPEGDKRHEYSHHAGEKTGGYSVWWSAGVNWTCSRRNCPTRRSAAAHAREYAKRIARRSR